MPSFSGATGIPCSRPLVVAPVVYGDTKPDNNYINCEE